MKTATTNEPPATAAQIAAWHQALQPRPGANAGLLTEAARYVTGSSNAELPALQAALGQADQTNLDRFGESAAMAALMPRLPWPEGRPVIERFCASPALFLKMIDHTGKAPAGLGDFLFEPARFRAAVDPATPEQLEQTLPRLLEPGQGKNWSLQSTTPRTDAIVRELLHATNAAWRAAAICTLSLRDDPKNQAEFDHALADSNRFVRAAAVSGLARVVKDRPGLERLLGPLLADADKSVAQRAAIGLLEPEVRAAAGLEYSSGSFEFEKIHAWPGSFESSSDQRPLAVIPGSPAFLEPLRQKLAGGSVSGEDAALPAIVLAQYGDFTGLDRLLTRDISGGNGRPDELEVVVLTAISLSRDVKYLPEVKKLLATAKEEQDFRRLLQAIKGMSGADARELRLDINKKLRAGAE